MILECYLPDALGSVNGQHRRLSGQSYAFLPSNDGVSARGDVIR
jgi:hypothetical protein